MNPYGCSARTDKVKVFRQDFIEKCLSKGKISNAHLSELTYAHYLSDNHQAVFNEVAKDYNDLLNHKLSYSCHVSAFEYTRERQWGTFSECTIFFESKPLLKVVRGYDADSFYRNEEQNYTLSPLKGLTE